jgi:(p)ppGpp synthase/HD superfamily hydrolase
MTSSEHSVLFSPLIEHAIELAAQWHDGTYRKGYWRDVPFDVPDGAILQVPVMAHVTAVAMTVMRAGWDEHVVAAAFLHDVLEDANRFDHNLRFAHLARIVGIEVARLVTEVTEYKCDDSGRHRTWRERKEDYVAGIRVHTPGAAAISLADKQHNLWNINQSLERGIDVYANGMNRRGLSSGPAEQLWFHQAVLDATRSHVDDRLHPMRDGLRFELSRFEVLSGLHGGT